MDMKNITKREEITKLFNDKRNERFEEELAERDREREQQLVFNEKMRQLHAVLTDLLDRQLVEGCIELRVSAQKWKAIELTGEISGRPAATLWEIKPVDQGFAVTQIMGRRHRAQYFNGNDGVVKHLVEELSEMTHEDFMSEVNHGRRDRFLSR